MALCMNKSHIRSEQTPKFGRSLPLLIALPQVQKDQLQFLQANVTNTKKEKVNPNGGEERDGVTAEISKAHRRCLSQ